MVSPHPVKFGGHGYCGKELWFFLSHVISPDYIIKGSCDFMGRIPSR